MGDCYVPRSTPVLRQTCGVTHTPTHTRSWETFPLCSISHSSPLTACLLLYDYIQEKNDTFGLKNLFVLVWLPFGKNLMIFQVVISCYCFIAHLADQSEVCYWSVLILIFYFYFFKIVLCLLWHSVTFHQVTHRNHMRTKWKTGESLVIINYN